MNRQILQGDVLEQINNIPDESIDTIITSPPYYALRDYGIDGQIGLESTLIEYVDKMVNIINSWKRVLKQTGSLWLNIGDTYHNSNKWTTTASVAQTVAKGNERGYYGKRKKDQGLRQKTLMGIPQRIMIRLIDDGWILRNTIIWHKPNTMPASVKDRLRNSYEPVYFFTKNEKYFFDLNAIRVPSQSIQMPFNLRMRNHKTNTAQAKLTGGTTVEEMARYDKQGIKKQDTVMRPEGIDRTKAGFNERYRNHDDPRGKNPGDVWTTDAPPQNQRKHSQQTVNKYISNGYDTRTGKYVIGEGGKNPGDVWAINTRPFPEAHHATFPIDLPMRIISCACPDGGIVLDPFFGSGSTAVAAEKLGRNWVGIELNPEYVAIAEKRLKPYQNMRIPA